MRVNLTVNGRATAADDVWEGESLLYVLRERLGLPGAKNACEQGECGSCTVYLDGTPVCACLVAAGQAEGRVVVTVEGLSRGDGPASGAGPAYVDGPAPGDGPDTGGRAPGGQGSGGQDAGGRGSGGQGVGGQGAGDQGAGGFGVARAADLSGEGLHEVQRAFLDAGAVQCGFCTPGLVVQAHALLAEVDGVPSDPDIREALAGNLCRCTGYEKILDAVRLAAARLRPPP